MLIKVFIIICLFTLASGTSFSSVYIFIEDSRSTGSLKGLLKETIHNDELEVVGYTSKSLNILLSKANQLQTSMVWLLRTGMESESLIVSRCGQSKVSDYTEDLAKQFMLMKSSYKRIDIGWIPYKDLKHITKQCLLVDIPPKTDLSSLSRDLSELFNFRDTDKLAVTQSGEKFLSTESEAPAAPQSSRKIPLKWEEFADATLREAQKDLSETIKKLSYDPDEDFFLNPFASSPTKSSTEITPSPISSNQILTSSNLNSFRKFNRSTRVTSSPEQLNYDHIAEATSASSIAETSINSGSLSVIKMSSNPSTYASTSSFFNASKVITNSKEILRTYSSIQAQLSSSSVENNASTSTTIQSTKQFNLLYDLRSDFRQELLDKFRKDKVIKTPEWLFEE